MYLTAAQCPDCGEERLLVEVGDAEFCCTSCDAAVLLFDVVPPQSDNGLSRKAG